MSLEAYTQAVEILPYFYEAIRVFYLIITRFCHSIHSSTNFYHTTDYKLQLTLERVSILCWLFST